MSLLSIVPARGGSQRLPDKNITSFLGKPLIWHTLDAVAPHSTTIILTSDSKAILDSGKEWGKENPAYLGSLVCHQRDPRLATNTSTVLDTVVHLSKQYFNYDAIGLFLPTAPLRDAEDVDAALNMWKASDADGIISTTDYEFPPTLALVQDPDGLIHCADKSLPFITGNTRSQDHVSMIRPNGAIYLKWMDVFQRDKNFFKGRMTNYHMPRERSADIDTLLDLKIAEVLANVATA